MLPYVLVSFVPWRPSHLSTGPSAFPLLGPEEPLLEEKKQTLTLKKQGKLQNVQFCLGENMSQSNGYLYSCNFFLLTYVVFFFVNF